MVNRENGDSSLSPSSLSGLGNDMLRPGDIDPNKPNENDITYQGASMSNYMKKIDEMRKNYRFRKDEIFKRMKVSTFAQLVLQVADVVNLEMEREYIESAKSRDENENVDEFTCPAEESADRANLENLINGMGEVDLETAQTSREEKELNLPSERNYSDNLSAPEATSLPYLLLDVREKDAYQQCHIIGALNYPSPMLSRSVNYLSKEMLEFKNKPGKIIVVYDDDEKLATHVATVLVQREIDNVIMLSGGMKVLNKKFPGCFLSGTVPPTCFSPPPERKGKKPKTPSVVTENVGVEWYTPELLERIQDHLDAVILDGEASSRNSSRVSRKSTSRSSVTSPRTVKSGTASGVWK